MCKAKRVKPMSDGEERTELAYELRDRSQDHKKSLEDVLDEGD